MKATVLVELLGAVVDGMDEQGSHANVLRHGHGTMNGVLKQCAGW
jgi:hypothetical protein